MHTPETACGSPHCQLSKARQRSKADFKCPSICQCGSSSLSLPVQALPDDTVHKDQCAACTTGSAVEHKLKASFSAFPQLSPTCCQNAGQKSGTPCGERKEHHGIWYLFRHHLKILQLKFRKKMAPEGCGPSLNKFSLLGKLRL